MHRAFIGQIKISPQTAFEFSDPKEIHHLKNVLRLKCDDTIAVFNAHGQEGLALITAINSSTITLQTISLQSPQKSQLFRIILACAIPKKAKFEWIIEKTSELGVDTIVPLLTARTEVRFTAAKAEQKQERYHQVALNAAKQSQRSTVPIINAPVKFLDFLKSVSAEKTMLLIPCLPGDRKHLMEIMPPGPGIAQIVIFIGPEGDFTPGEIAAAQEHGAIPVSLGQTVLKVDTAAIAVVSMLNFYNRPNNPA